MIYGSINCQKLSLASTYIVADTIDFLEAEFFFQSADWEGLEKWAHFTKGVEVYDIRLTEDRIRKEDHLNLTAGKWQVYLHGNEYNNGEVTQRVTTNEVTLYVEPTGTLDGEPFPEIPASVTEQILARLEDVEQNGGGSGGYSPTVKLEPVEGGVRVTITDKDGTTSEVIRDGEPGTTPHIGENGNWWIGDVDTGVQARGDAKIDDTLEKPGYAADAKAVGEKIDKLSKEKVDKDQGAKNAGKLLYIGADGIVVPLTLGNGLKIENGVLMLTNATVTEAICGRAVCGEIICGGV